MHRARFFITNICFSEDSWSSKFQTLLHTKKKKRWSVKRWDDESPVLLPFTYGLCHVFMTQGSPISVFLLVGHSNMFGRGGVINDIKRNNLIWDGILTLENTPNLNILTLNLDKTWKVAWEQLHRQVNRLKACGIGPGMPFFAHEILAKDPSFGVFGLAPCAIEGTNIGDSNIQFMDK